MTHNKGASNQPHPSQQPQQPKRLNSSLGPKREHNPKEGPNDKKFNLPDIKLDLEFFLKRGDQKYTEDELIKEMFGEAGFKMTEHEKVYSVLKALEDLELTMPFEFDCPACGEKNPIGVEVAKVMKTSGESKSAFDITLEHNNIKYLFKFERPDHIATDVGASGLASIGMFIMQWLVGHNQGPAFEFIHLPVAVILKLAKQFSQHMMVTSFSATSKCHKCKGDIDETFEVSMADITTLVNEL